MAKKKSSPKKSIPKPKPPRTKKEPKVEEFMEIGGSPVPGITLRHVLRGHTGAINRIAWSLDGQYLATPSTDQTIRIWNIKSGKCISTLEGHNGNIYSVTWSPRGDQVASVSDDGEVLIWHATGKRFKKLEVDTNAGSVAWSPEGRLLVCGTRNHILAWETQYWEKS